MMGRRDTERERESRMSATGGYDVRPVPGTETGRKVEERASEVGREASRRITEIKDVTSQRLGEAGEALRDVANQVEVEQFILRGHVAEHPFRIEIEGENADRYLVFEFNFRTDDGDTVRFTGRKHMAVTGTGVSSNLPPSTSARSTLETRSGGY